MGSSPPLDQNPPNHLSAGLQKFQPIPNSAIVRAARVKVQSPREYNALHLRIVFLRCKAPPAQTIPHHLAASAPHANTLVPLPLLGHSLATTALSSNAGSHYPEKVLPPVAVPRTPPHRATKCNRPKPNSAKD